MQKCTNDHRLRGPSRPVSCHGVLVVICQSDQAGKENANALEEEVRVTSIDYELKIPRCRNAMITSQLNCRKHELP